MNVRFFYIRETTHGWRDGRIVSLRAEDEAGKLHIQNIVDPVSGQGIGLPVAVENGKQPTWVGQIGGATGWKEVSDADLIGIAKGDKVVDVPSGQIKDEVDPDRKTQWDEMHPEE